MQNNRGDQKDPDQDQRDNSNIMGDSTAKTVEFLRARLLAERAVSRTARERADELAKRVVELEDQLKIVSLQRKKAEKATADVLAILEDRGLSDFSEEIDSSSDQEINNFESKLENDFQEEESPVGLKIERNHRNDLSGFEIETSSLPGRSLSWKSGRDSPSSDRKKYINSQKRSPFTSPSFSSPRRSAGGKSCRRIRPRETRSSDDESINGSKQALPENGDAASAQDCQNSNLNIGPGDLENRMPEALLSNHLDEHSSSRQMERALENQVQLIGRYEEEEKAQREWEDKFRENNSSPVSCERVTTRSDITEEREEFKSDSAPNPIQTNDSVDFKAKANIENVQSSFIKKLGDPQSSPLQPDARYPQKRGNSDTMLVSLSKGDNTSRSTQTHDPMPRQVPDKVGSVLQSLQQAKLLLNHKLKAPSPSNGGSYGKAIEVPIGCDELFRVPSDYYLETTLQSNNNPQASNLRSSLTNYPYKGTAVNLTDQFITSRSTDSWPRFPSINPSLSHPNNFKNRDLNLNGDVQPRLDRGIPFPSPYMYNGPNVDPNSVHSSYAPPTYPSNRNPLLQMPYGGEHQFSGTDISRVGTRPPYSGEQPLNHFRARSLYGDEIPFTSPEINVFPSSYAAPSYPIYGDPVLQAPSGGERLFSTGSGVGRADLSFYNHTRPDMYR